ncbi:MAG: hypothetical protein BJ554DRAFT_2165 [Olpidium bornovanus]|uniref:Chromo domain-containing protein n=1 Tax=Olpidium bornovanus TaxID=278681 RepID=A0A8H8A137_9FUNG|nr:MAG: hypothetical protein BJ554DRAFT_2165 [Olpidium bornovanus]
MLEFLHNWTPHMTTGQSPHLLAYGTDLRGIDGIRQGTALEYLPQILQDVRASLQKAQSAQVVAYNHRRREIKLAVGDQVLFRRDAIAHDDRLAAKYRAFYIGPYMVTHIKIDKDNYWLALPEGMQIHSVFHISLLQKYQEPDAGHQVSRPGPVGNDEYEVDTILATRLRHGRRQYLVLWLGDNALEATRAYEESLENAQDSVAKFRNSHLRATSTAS